MKFLFVRALLAVTLGVSPLWLPATANASGTVRVQRPDGSVTMYTNVRIRANYDNLAITSSDGQGTLVFGRASCTKVGEILQCLPYDAILFQNGEKTRIALKHGMVWYNPSKVTQTLSHSSTQLPYHGVLLTAESERGTYVSLTGVLDGVLK